LTNKSITIALVAAVLMLTAGSSLVFAAGGPGCTPDPSCCNGKTVKSSSCCPGGTNAKSADCTPSGSAKCDKDGATAKCQPAPDCCDKSSSSSSDSKIGKSAPSKTRQQQKSGVGSGS